MSRPKRPAWLAQLRRDLDCAVERDPAARTTWEVALLYSGVHAVWAYRASHGLWRHRAYFPARALAQAARWATGIEIHPAARIGGGVFIDHGSGVVIGETAEVGNDVTLYQGVTLGGTSLGRGKRHPTIGDRVTIGAGAKVLGNLTVGDDSQIGANAVLVRSVGDHSVVVGVPGQVISSSRPDAHRVKPAADSAPQSDPVGSTLQSLLRRVDQLETQTSGHSETSELQMFSVGVWEATDFSI
jgi:serine O-acetyltransferase